MGLDSPQILSFSRSARASCHSGCDRSVIVSSYATGAPKGNNLGTPGYSYDFVVKLFAPLIERWGRLVVVPREKVDAAVAEARSRGYAPVHLSFLPLQDVCLATDAPNIVVPAWEYPDIPDHAFDQNPQNNWVEMAARCDSLIVGGPFTVAAFRRAGVRSPIHTVQVPIPDGYFEVPAWIPGQETVLSFSGHTFSWPVPMQDVVEHQTLGLLCRNLASPRRWANHCVSAARFVYRRTVALVLPKHVHYAMKAALSSGVEAWRGTTQSFPFAKKKVKASQPLLDVSGVVYTSIFNPKDHRKNWEDLLTGFLCAMKDHEDATLVLKLITNDPAAVDEVWNFYRGAGIPHRCRVVFVSGFLQDDQLLELAQASTYYITTTRAEGNCLPLMNYLAAGRPGISPCHTAISDYFDQDVGFVVDSHPEPAAFPHDSRLRKTTTWHRLVWPSLVDEIRRSYHIAKHEPAEYERLSGNARERLFRWASVEPVAARLQEALEATLQLQGETSTTTMPHRQVAAA